MELLKVAKWGNSLAIRIPSKMVKEMGLKEGDTIRRDLLDLRRVRTKMNREEALRILQEARDEFPKDLKPEDWKIDHNDPDMRG
ncbi:MAG: AbrB/MazE/SpoVT family DNA-binding domain-containing protein [Novosphingobium sp.]